MKEHDLSLTVQIGEDKKLVCVCVCVHTPCPPPPHAHFYLVLFPVWSAVAGGTGGVSKEQQVCVAACVGG